MRLTKTNINYQKKGGLQLTFLLLILLAIPAQATPVNLIIQPVKESGLMAQTTSSNLSQKSSVFTAGFIDNPKIEGLRQIILLLTLAIVLLCFFSILLWKRYQLLVYESSLIKSKLDQYLRTNDVGESQRLMHEEHKQQVLALNERQQKIVDLMAFGFSNKQIADKLFISENTVKYHIKNIYHVLHVKDRKTLWLSQS